MAPDKTRVHVCLTAIFRIALFQSYFTLKLLTTVNLLLQYTCIVLYLTSYFQVQISHSPLPMQMCQSILI